MDNPVIICGLGRVGWRVLEHLRLAGRPVVAVDARATPDDIRLVGVRFVHGDFRRRETLTEAGVASAEAVLVLTSDDLVNISTALMVRHLNPDVRLVVRLFNENLVPRLGKAVAHTQALSVSRLTAPLLTLVALEGQALAAFTAGGRRYAVAELGVDDRSPLRHRPAGAIAAHHHARLVAQLPDVGQACFLGECDPDRVLRRGDRLVVCGDQNELRPLLEASSGAPLPELSWAGWSRRMGRVVWRTLAEVELPVKISGAVLVTALMVSTIFYYYLEDSFTKSCYYAVGLIATAGDMHVAKPGLPHLIAGALRLSGVALLASFTAILTNYLVRARLSGALEVRRIPDSGHVVVCGLGNIGFSVVEELLRSGQRVVVIDKNRDGRFMAAVRRRHVATIVGDATVIDVLRLAHAGTARAIIATVTEELANLEIALLARELNPTVRAVVCFLDPNLAQTLREEADIRFALSIPTLAAPAFLAALYGDRVHTVFLIQGRLFAVVDLVVKPGDRLLGGHTAAALAREFHLLPVVLLRADGSVTEDPAEHLLKSRDRLTCIAPVSCLERLLRRERLPAEWAVEVEEIPAAARMAVVDVVRERGGMDGESAAAAVARGSLRLGGALSRGEAEEVRDALRQAGAAARLRGPADATAAITSPAPPGNPSAAS